MHDECREWPAAQRGHAERRETPPLINRARFGSRAECHPRMNRSHRTQAAQRGLAAGCVLPVRTLTGCLVWVPLGVV